MKTILPFSVLTTALILLPLYAPKNAQRLAVARNPTLQNQLQAVSDLYGPYSIMAVSLKTEAFTGIVQSQRLPPPTPRTKRRLLNDLEKISTQHSVSITCVFGQNPPGLGDALRR